MFSIVAAHSSLDLETVAQLSNGIAEVSSVVRESDTLRGAVPLSTCNRVEIYAESTTADPTEAARELFESIAEHSEMSVEDVTSSFMVLDQDASVRHLFEVGSGLKSSVVGEREIAGQVRRALSTAKEAKTTTGGLTKLFESATRTAKDVGAQTALGATGRSIVSVALEITTQTRAGTTPVAVRRFWEDANVLLIGTGSYAGTTLAQLEQLGAKNVAVHSASGRAEKFVADRGGWATALGGRSVMGAFAEADVLIGASGGERRVSADDLARLRENATHRLTVVDLALTHDFDPAIADLPGVDLITLETVKLAAPEQQQASIVDAQHIVDTAVEGFISQVKARSAGDAIVALRNHTMNVLDEEMERVRARHGCTAAAEEVELAMRRMVKQLLHEPTVRARHLAAEGRLSDYEAALETLFGLNVAEETRLREERKQAKAKEQQPAPQAQSEAPATEYREIVCPLTGRTFSGIVPTKLPQRNAS